jgi:hypothetical protein
MGCDFYTQICTEITYLDASGATCSHQELEEREPHYHYTPRYYIPSHIDPDFQEIPPEYKLDPLAREIKDYGVRVLFADGQWKCVEYGQRRVELICEENGLPFDRIVEVKKYMTGWWR